MPESAPNFEVFRPILSPEARQQLLNTLKDTNKISAHFERWKDTKLTGLEVGSPYYNEVMYNRDTAYKIFDLLKQRLQKEKEKVLHGPEKNFPLCLNEFDAFCEDVCNQYIRQYMGDTDLAINKIYVKNYIYFIQDYLERAYDN